MRSVAIHHPIDPRRPTLIRADRFDPKRHRPWNEGGDGAVAPPEASVSVSDLAPEPESDADD